jgi:hypothetical protein
MGEVSLCLLTRADGSPLGEPWAIDPPWDTPAWAERRREPVLTAPSDDELYAECAGWQGDDIKSTGAVSLSQEEYERLTALAKLADEDPEEQLYQAWASR